VQEKSAVILLVLDAKNASASLDIEGIKELIYCIVWKEGLTPVSTLSSSNDWGVTVVVIKEGYMIAQMWPVHKYCAFNINHWGSFQKTQKVRAALLEAAGSASISSYRVIVGGMYGSTTWREDQKLLIVPQIVQTRNCDDDDTNMDGIIATRVAVDKVINIVHNRHLLVAVLCCIKEERREECLSTDVAGKHNNVENVITLWACPSLDNGDDSLTKLANIYKCEKSISFNFVYYVRIFCVAY
jgi:hypothetical protein